MKKRLLIYEWGSLLEPGFVRTVKELGIDFVTFSHKMNNYHADAGFAQAFIGIIHAKKVDVVFSYDYFPMIAMICEMNHIPYLSWIYDCPLYTLESKTLSCDCNYFFCFDKAYAARLRAAEAKHCVHYPLAADMKLLKAAEGLCEESRYTCEISFVGNLYNEQKNRLRRVTFMPQTADAVEELIQKQLDVYGENCIKQSLPEAAAAEIVEKCELKLGAEYRQDDLQMAADAICMEVSARERETVLSVLGTYYPVTWYGGAELPGELKRKQIRNAGYADYAKEMPLIFKNSKINLNITSKTIETGIPQRVFDILACGGFCLTNYQPEVVACFADGRELVTYQSMEDLLAKTAYYLQHEEERWQIAERGQRKAREQFSLEKRVFDMLTVFLQT